MFEIVAGASESLVTDWGHADFRNIDSDAVSIFRVVMLHDFSTLCLRGQTSHGVGVQPLFSDTALSENIYPILVSDIFGAAVNILYQLT
jgi:hypothetical protein